MINEFKKQHKLINLFEKLLNKLIEQLKEKELL